MTKSMRPVISLCTVESHPDSNEWPRARQRQRREQLERSWFAAAFQGVVFGRQDRRRKHAGSAAGSKALLQMQARDQRSAAFGSKLPTRMTKLEGLLRSSRVNRGPSISHCGTPRSILRSSFGPQRRFLLKSMSSGNLASAPSRAIAIPTNGRAHGGDSVASGSSVSGSPPPFGESFLNAKIRGETHAGSIAAGSKALLQMQARDQRSAAFGSEAPDEDDKWGPSLESSPDAPGGDEVEGQRRRGEALIGLGSPLHELLERNREDADRTEASSSRHGSVFNIIDSTSALELIDEVTESDDVPPLATPEVSKHGTNEAWLFMSQSQRHQRFSDTGDTDGSGPEDSDHRVHIVQAREQRSRDAPQRVGRVVQ